MSDRAPGIIRLLRDDIAPTDTRDLPAATACLDDHFAVCIVHLKFPLGHRRAIRITNLLERLFVCSARNEERRRTKVIPHAFGERAVLKLMYAALIRAAERWPGIKVSEFEKGRKVNCEQSATRSTRILLLAMPRLRAHRVLQPQPIYPEATGLELSGW